MSSQVSHSTDEGGGMRSQSTQDDKGTWRRSGSQALASSRTEQISLKDLPPGPRTGTVTLVINTVQRHPISSHPADLKGPPTKERGKPPPGTYESLSATRATFGQEGPCVSGFVLWPTAWRTFS